MRQLSFAALLLVLLPVLATPVVANPNEPQVLIYHKEDKTFYEYRQNGALIEIKVVPKKGTTYYLIPSESGGRDNMMRLEESSLVVPSWVVFRW